MSRSLPAALLVLFLGLWLAASYGVRYGLMEDGQWVGLCTAPAAYWQCEVRSLRGLGIHHQVMAWGYRVGSGSLAVRIYDPNWPDRDDVELRVTVGADSGDQRIELAQSTGEPLLGFFRARYEPPKRPRG